MTLLAFQPSPPAALTRLTALAALTQEDQTRITLAMADRATVAPRRDVVVEGERIHRAHLMVAGWAFRARMVPSGQRQIVDFVLPGELIGLCARANPVGVATTTALTQVTTCLAPLPDPADKRSNLQEAYAVSAAIEEAVLFRQVTRIGRMNAFERLIDWLLEMHDRLLLAGLASPDEFAIPLTQEIIADTLGLTSVHVNRTVKALRESGLATLSAKQVRLHNRREMERVVHYAPITVVA